MGINTTEARGAPGTVAIPRVVPVAETMEYVSEATTGCEQSRRAYPVSTPPSPRVVIVAKEFCSMRILPPVERRSAPMPTSDTWHVAEDPPLLAIRNRDVYTVPSLPTPSTTWGNICVVPAFCA